jgi:hypothetical protein
MQLKRSGSQSPDDLPGATKWRHLDEASVPRDETAIEIPETEQTASEFFDELKAIIYTMKGLGLFPLQKGNPGLSKFSRNRLLEFEVTMRHHF